jgi:hypothetical protein
MPVLIILNVSRLILGTVIFAVETPYFHRGPPVLVIPDICRTIVSVELIPPIPSFSIELAIRITLNYSRPVFAMQFPIAIPGLYTSFATRQHDECRTIFRMKLSLFVQRQPAIKVVSEKGLRGRHCFSPLLAYSLSGFLKLL